MFSFSFYMKKIDILLCMENYNTSESEDYAAFNSLLRLIIREHIMT